MRKTITVPTEDEIAHQERILEAVKAHEDGLWKAQQAANRAWLDYRQETLKVNEEALAEMKALRNAALKQEGGE